MDEPSTGQVQAVVVPGQLIPRELIDQDDVVAVTQALRDGADPNAAYEKHENHPLHIATGMRARRVLRLLVNNGADVNAVNKHGMTALLNTATNDSPALAEFLIQEGADPSLGDNWGRTPLMRAAYLGFDKVVTVLLDGGAGVTARTPAGETALSQAASAGNTQNVKLLLAGGAQVDQTVIDVAQKRDDRAILRLLGVEPIRDERATELLAAAAARRNESEPVSPQLGDNKLPKQQGNESGRSSTTAAEFHMIHATRGNLSMGAFDIDGPRLGTMQKAPIRLDFITHDPRSGIYFGQNTGTLGVIDNGELIPIETPENVDLSHAGGLAFDAEHGSVLVASRDGAGTVLFEYTVDGNTWNEIGNIGRDDFHGLACDGAQGTIYVLDKPHDARGCTNVRVLNRSGAQVAAIDLSTPIPFYSELQPKIQLAFAEGTLYAMASTKEKHPRFTESIFAIEPASGEVNRMPYNAAVDLTSTTWPGWTGGPRPSLPKYSAGAKGRGFYSTPRSNTRSSKSSLKRLENR